MDGLQYTFNRRMMTEHWVGALDLEFCGIGYGSFGDMMGFLGLGVLGLRLLRLSCISCRDGMLSATSGVWAWDWHGIGMEWGFWRFPGKAQMWTLSAACLLGREGDKDHGVYSTMDCLLMIIFECSHSLCACINPIGSFL
jgi:hypothetical protein